MPKQTIEYLKTRFETGDKPTAQDFVDLLDTLSADDASLLVAETVVTGSAVTSVTFSGLNGTVAGGYRLEGYITGLPVAAYLMLKPNGASATNTFGTSLKAVNTTVTSTYHGTDAVIKLAENNWTGGSASIGRFVVDLVNEVALVQFRGLEGSAFPSIVISHYQLNVGGTTSLTVESSTANGIGVNSTFRLYKRK